MTHPHSSDRPRRTTGRFAAYATARLVGGRGPCAYGLAGVVICLFALTATPAFAAEACPNQELRQQQRSTALPDCRAYELVSPPDKSGLDVIQETDKTHVTPDGDGVTFAALGGFGSLQGTSFDAEYLSRRTATPGTNGWSTQGINPPGGSDSDAATVTANVSSYVDAFTPDLSAGIYKSWRPLTAAPNVADISNLYRINGLGGQKVTAQLMSDAVSPPPWSTLGKLRSQPAFAGASTDLSHVVFESPLNLTADAPPYAPLCLFSQGVFGCPARLYENANGVVRLVGRIPNGTDKACDDVNGPACVTADSAQAGIGATLGEYSRRMVSADGRRIFFQAPVDADTGAIYMREDGTRTVQLAQDGQLWDASPDGSRVYFTTSESLLPADTDSNPDLYMYDANAPADARLTLISASSTANDGTADTVVGASDDGHYVYFVADGQLVPGEPPAEIVGLYVWHDGTLSFLGQLQGVGEARLNGPRTLWDFPSSTSTSRATPDGRHLLFMTQGDEGFRGREGFAGYDHAGRQELYLYSADTNRLVCASCNPSGKAATVDALTNLTAGTAVSPFTSDLTHALSDDGRRVFFTTAEALSPEDTNGVLDAYEYDAATGAVHLLSSGTDPSPSYLIDASNDGSDAFIATRQRLLGWDTDGNYDLYDARIAGGFPEPTAPAPACSGEGCLPQNGQTPGAAVPSTATYSGPGNLTPPAAITAPTRPRPKPHRKCLRHTAARRVRGHTRCVRRGHRHTSHATRASTGGRTHRSGR